MRLGRSPSLTVMIRKLSTFINTNFQLMHWHKFSKNCYFLLLIVQTNDQLSCLACGDPKQWKYGTSRRHLAEWGVRGSGRQTIVAEWSHWSAKQHGLHIPQGTYTVGLSWSVVLDNGYDKYTLLIPTLLSHSPSQGVLHCAAQGKPHSREPIYTAWYLRQ